MEDRITLKIVTASGVVLDRLVSYVSLPTPDGSVGILADHAPMLCAVGDGFVRYRCDGNEMHTLSVAQGVAGIQNNELTVLVDRAQNAD